MAGSSGTIEYPDTLGVPLDRIVLSNNIVDNARWAERAAKVDRDAVRASWRIPASASVALFSAKLQSWKAPRDVLEAFARADVPNYFLVYAGDGSPRGALEQRARDLGISERVRIFGFVNQSQLPSGYRGADLFVLLSLYEPFGLVVNEAMVCGCPVAVSERVDAKYDLVREGGNGCVFPATDVEALTAVLVDFFSNSDKRTSIGVAARKRMETWSPHEYVNGLAEALELAARLGRREGNKGPGQ
jgi:glycosyltransferase involved in cell wall biosynthesis